MVTPPNLLLLFGGVTSLQGMNIAIRKMKRWTYKFILGFDIGINKD
jgi:hypothetical protein